MKKQKTENAIKEKVSHNWVAINADGAVLGRVASEVAKILMGKHNTNYTPSVDTGDYVVVYNAEKIKVTGNKANQKMYYRHSGYPGGLKETPYKRMLAKFPERIIYAAVRGMIPKTRLGRQMLKKLKVYSGENHPHEAQLSNGQKES